MINNKLLKEEMENQGLNINKLSNISGVDKSVISRITKGETKSCTVDTAQKISEALNLSANKLGLIFFANEVADTQRDLENS